ncbi:sensor histidine kinase [Anaerocolumna xylanovorans]|uniref:histidine kinase n=1 Tax=Anaerocolumna xylanovorans DSM 12503 TaxID=1121345 RepID=A0A1M7Y5C7_9FIRM|nr:HAMP domain-containing sensor histidine kinase [Anaerocolumna xylanovorans]SHO47655.1 Signal transduction histidine kinase [Anaerocolumna xylanovorans DSM 12503]
MVLKKYETNTLFLLFLKQLLLLAFSILLEIFVFLALFDMGLNSGYILPANYSEHYLEQNKEKIANSEPFNGALVPHTCQYGLFGISGKYLSGSLSDAGIEDGKAFIKGAYTGNGYYFLIKRAEGYCVVKYDISAHFAAPILHKIFPKPELIVITLFLIIFVMIAVNNALFFGRRLKKELEPVLEEISQIQTRELNIAPKKSKIKEINDILLSLYDMESALAQSLKKEWETEQKRKSNISALAHDIKTPLTIIKGNSELILEENNINEVYTLADIINKHSDKIERYVKLLIEETNHNFSEDYEERIEVTALIADITAESEAFLKATGVELIINNQASDGEAVVNRDSIVRAVLNLIKNAAEHTALNKTVKLTFGYAENRFTVEIEDYGRGFTSEALKYAKNQFYTEKSERSEEHYGLGMYYAGTVAEKYNGSLLYYNKPAQTGAVVVFEISADGVKREAM